MGVSTDIYETSVGLRQAVGAGAMGEEARGRRAVAEAERLDLEHGATYVRVESRGAELASAGAEGHGELDRAHGLGNAEDAELLELLGMEVRKVDADAALLVRVHKLGEDLQCARVDLVDLCELAEG